MSADPKQQRQAFEAWLNKQPTDKTKALFGDNPDYVKSLCDILESKFDKKYQVGNIFAITDPQKIMEYRHNCLRGEWQEWDKSIGGGDPKTALRRYLQFLKQQPNEGNDTTQENNPMAINKKQPLNQILYGPPGTGKTFNTVKIALKVLGGEAYFDSIKSISDLKDEFGDRVEFVTFHQNFTYEDFIEGIKPNLDGNDKLSYSIIDGIFKEIAKRARKKVKGIDRIGLNDAPTVWKASLGKDGELKQECFNTDRIRYRNSKGEEENIPFNSFKQIKSGDLVIVHKNASGDEAGQLIDGIAIVVSEEMEDDEHTQGYNYFYKVKWLLKDEVLNVLKINNGKKLTLSAYYKTKIKAEDLLDHAGLLDVDSDEAKTDVSPTKEQDMEVNVGLLLKNYAREVKGKIESGEAVYLNIANNSRKGDREIAEVHYRGGNLPTFMVSDQSLTGKIVARDFNPFLNGEIDSINDIKPRLRSRSPQHGNARFYFALYQALKEFYNKNREAYHQILTDDKVPTQIGGQMLQKQNYVLIIDEINRGNIAKIFGELITLLEHSKREGNDEPISVTLPYSQESFTVPNNLYIIGTMNTTDRSIALLDTALRRRFHFVEMMPMPHLDEIADNAEGVDCRALLNEINYRIEVLLDREHQIGHSYFINVKSVAGLKDRFQNNIIPLLQEYFYGQWDRINAVLNNNGFIKSQAVDVERFPKGAGVSVESGQQIYSLLPFGDDKWNKADSYIAIYESAQKQGGAGDDASTTSDDDEEGASE